MHNESTKEHILLSTIEAIEKHGLTHLTTRLIAEEAGVNNAALHYYYGTKEQLVDAALNQTTRHFLEDAEVILSSERPIDARLQELLDYILDGVARYPNIIRAHLLGPLYYANRQEELMYLFGSWLQLAEDAILKSGVNENKQQIKFSLNMIFSSILMSGLFNTPGNDNAWMDLQDPEMRAAFINQAVEMLLAP